MIITLVRLVVTAAGAAALTAIAAINRVTPNPNERRPAPAFVQAQRRTGRS